MKHIYWFAYFDHRSPSVRYRAIYPLEWLRRTQGISYHLVFPGYSPMRLVRFMKAYFSALLLRRKDSMIVIQRVRSGFIYATALKLLISVRKQGTVYDLDDADYLEHPPRHIHAFASMCAHVSAGSQAIMEHLRTFNPSTTLVTSPVVDLRIVKQKRSPIFTIGWVGDFGSGHREGLVQQVFPTIKRLSDPTRLVLIGVMSEEDRRWILDYFTLCAHLRIDLPNVRSWLDEAWLQERISGFDVGIATLLDTPVQRAKSGIKAKQYLNNGVPVLSTYLPENDWVVVPGVNGFFFNGPDELEARLDDLRRMSDDEYGRLSTGARSSIVGFDHAGFFRDLTRVTV